MNVILTVNSETKTISIQVLQELQKQGESLHLTNNHLIQSNEHLNISNKILNLMSWSGWFMSFIPFRHYFSNLFIRKTSFDRINLSNSKSIYYNLNVECCDNIKTRCLNNCVFNDKNLSDSINYSELNDSEKDELNKLEKDIIELSYIGKEIGHQLDLHNSNLDLINEKMKILEDVTKKINKKTSGFL